MEENFSRLREIEWGSDGGEKFIRIINASDKDDYELFN